jgi:hypothetical protein
VASPKPPLDGNIERAIRAYLVDRKGKALVLLDVPAEGSVGDKSALPATGLESLLGQLNVELPNQRILSVLFTTGGGARATDGGIFEVNPELARTKNELYQAFSTESFLLRRVRVVRAAPMGGNPALRAEPLLVTKTGMLTWAEGDLQADILRKANLVLTNRAESEKIVSKEPLPAAVMVTESAPVPPSMGAPPPPAKPRLVVIGDATLATNAMVSEQSGQPIFSFLASTLDWLAERPTSIGIESKDLPVYVMDPAAAEKASTRLVWLPVLLALVGIVGLGAGVWVVRRR